MGERITIEEAKQCFNARHHDLTHAAQAPKAASCTGSLCPASERKEENRTAKRKKIDGREAVIQHQEGGAYAVLKPVARGRKERRDLAKTARECRKEKQPTSSDPKQIEPKEPLSARPKARRDGMLSPCVLEEVVPHR